MTDLILTALQQSSLSRMTISQQGSLARVTAYQALACSTRTKQQERVVGPWSLCCAAEQVQQVYVDIMQAWTHGHACCLCAEGV